MTPLPKRRLSSQRQGKRRKHITLPNLALAKCDNCKNLKIPHRVCSNCGTYKGTVFVAPKIKTKVNRIKTEEK